MHVVFIWVLQIGRNSLENTLYNVTVYVHMMFLKPHFSRRPNSPGGTISKVSEQDDSHKQDQVNNADSAIIFLINH